MFKETLPDLPYDYNALEPVISAEIMQLHHQKHHAGYVAGFNTALEALGEAIQKKEMDKMISLQSALKFHGGGHINHTLFWESLTPEKNFSHVEGALGKAIDATFGSFEEFVKTFNAQTGAIQGSGWGWLSLSPKSKNLSIVTCANQDPLWGTTGLLPLLGIDVWEHAYYLQYKNVRADYLKNIWRIVDWKRVAKRYEKAISS